jgi:mycothione reductase
MSRTHDVVVIGAGSGNMVIGPEFDDLDVAIVEERRFGGTCLNYGCIPSKMLAYSAEVAEIAAHAHHFDVTASSGVSELGWSSVRDRVSRRTDEQSQEGLDGRRDSPNITVYEDRAHFIGARHLRIGEVEVRAEQVVIAAGGRPAVPSVVLEAKVPFETSDTIMRTAAAPRRLAILGGGYIAAEMAHVLASAGSHVTMIARSDLLLGDTQDDLIRQRYTTVAQRRHDVRLGSDLTGVRADPRGLALTLDGGEVVHADMLLVATGRRPNTDRLEVQAAGVDTDDGGLIVVDDYGRTSAPGVWALGDITASAPLKHVANREARAVRHNLRHPDDLRAVDHSQVPSAVFTVPQMASVGMTEAQCRERNVDYSVGIAEYGEVAYGWAMQDDTGVCKILADPRTDRILGAHLLGPQAATLIQVLVVAMKFGVAAADLAEQPYWIHPALTEVVEHAVLDLHRAP